MMPLAISILSEQLKVKLESIKNFDNFGKEFELFIENRKTAIKDNHLKFIQENMVLGHKQLKSYVMYMMMDLPVTKSIIIPRYLDKKYMHLIKINNTDSNQYKIVPINYLALKALDEYYSNDDSFFTSTYIDQLLIEYQKFNSDSCLYINIIDSNNRILLYFKTMCKS